ncbi:MULTISPECIES: hypothetical protein [unclassified Streptomyces]|uniref:hypothetical protein n=1 Tax=unclassified Streptomyces TaxID=2593676 RepID=UPI00352EED60
MYPADGFTEVEITPTHVMADGMHSAIVRAAKPMGAGVELPVVTREEAVSPGGISCCR